MNKTSLCTTFVVLALLAPALMAPGSDPCPDCANLSVEMIEWGQLSMKVTVRNDGCSASSWGWVDLFVDQTQSPQYGDLSSHYKYLGPLKSGESRTIKFPLSRKPWTAAVIVDSTIRISETTKDDNVLANLSDF